jgi:hypothetical protein
VETARRDPGQGRRTADALDRLRPGDVVTTRRGGGRAVVLKHESGRSGGRLMMLGTNREVFRLGPADFLVAPSALAHIELPRPFAPRSLTFRRAAAEDLRAARLREPAPVDDDPRDGALASHPAASCPKRARHL